MPVDDNFLFIPKTKVVVCSCLNELHQWIDVTQLTTELGGTLPYHHQEWIDTRVVIWIHLFPGGSFE